MITATIDRSLTATAGTAAEPAASAESRLAQDVLREARSRCEPVQRALVDELPARLRRVAGYHAGWWDTDGRPTRPADKGLRPALVLASAAAISGSGTIADSPARAVAAAVAVQLVHEFSLLHDDIMDGDRFRRHRPAAWSVFGAGEAILAGDMLHAQATRLMAETGTADVEVLAAAAVEMCAGQALDLDFERRLGVPLSDCLAMLELKTGALLGCCCELGALAAGADRSQAAALRAFGRHVGVAFQLADDLLGIGPGQPVTGKAAYGDLIRRKRSFPIAVALASSSAAGHEFGELFLSDQMLDLSVLARAASLVEAAGGIAETRAQAAAALRRALDCLHTAVPSPGAARDLELLGGLVSARAGLAGAGPIGAG
jgi:geranylgeranyl diphosphate synthase, type I